MTQHRLAGINSVVATSVIDHIREHKLRVGDTLPSEQSFAEAAGVSRTIVRETFGALSALQLIDVGNGRRARVGSIDGSMLALMMTHAVHTEQSTVPQIWDVRRALEKRAVALAAMQRTNAQAQTIARYAKQMRLAGDETAEQTEKDIAFHVAIARATRNPIFGLLISSFSDVMRETCPIGWRSRRTEEERVAVFDQHDRIAQAIIDRDPEAAEIAMELHFSVSLTTLLNSGYS